jgi:hypothetical protein
LVTFFLSIEKIKMNEKMPINWEVGIKIGALDRATYMEKLDDFANALEKELDNMKTGIQNENFNMIGNAANAVKTDAFNLGCEIVTDKLNEIYEIVNQVESATWPKDKDPWSRIFALHKEMKKDLEDIRNEI